MEKQKRILQVINGMGTGGAEKDIMNWYRNLDKTKYQFDFLIRSNEEFYKDEIEKNGGKVYKVASFPKNILKNLKETKAFFKAHKEEYSAVHVHGNALIYIYPLIIAKKCGIKVRAMHSHSTKANGKVASLIHRIHRIIIRKYANVLIACSDESGKFAYGNKEYIVIKNAMDMKKYNTKASNESLKNSFNLDEDTMVIGHIGRFLPVKNHEFLISIFEELSRKVEKSVLFLIGSGPLMTDIKNKVEEKGLQDKVFFLGERSDVENLLEIIDMIIFPSIYEGVPLVVLEGQASGTKVIYSDSIDDQVKVTPYARKMSLSKSAFEWASAAIEFSKENIECNIESAFSKAGYTVDTTLQKILQLYENTN